MHLHHDGRCTLAFETERLAYVRIDDGGGASTAPATPGPMPPREAPTAAPKPGDKPSGTAKVDVQDVTDPRKPVDLGDAGQAAAKLNGSTKSAVENAGRAAQLLRENDKQSGVSEHVMIRVPHEVVSSPAATIPPGATEADAMMVVPDQNVVKTFQMQARWQGAVIPRQWEDAKLTDELLPEDVALHETAHLNQLKYAPDAFTAPSGDPGGGATTGSAGPADGQAQASGTTASASANLLSAAQDDLIGKAARKSDAGTKLAATLGGGLDAVGLTGGSTDGGSVQSSDPGASSGGTSTSPAGPTAMPAMPSQADSIEHTAVAEGMADAVAMTVSHDWAVGEDYFQGKSSAVRDASKTRKEAGDVGAFDDYGTISGGLAKVRDAETQEQQLMAKVQAMTPEERAKISKADMQKLQKQADDIDKEGNDGLQAVGGDDGHQAGTIISRTFYELQKTAGWDGAEQVARAVGDDKELWSGDTNFEAVAQAMERNADAIDTSGKLRGQVDAALGATHLADAIPAPQPRGGRMRAI